MLTMLNRPGLPRLAYHHRIGTGPTIVFLCGYASDMTGAKALALDAWAERRGQAMLRFDYRGCGASEGVFGDATLDDWRDDALHLIDGQTQGPLILIGSSMGGWLMLLLANERPERIAGLIGIAAAPDFTEWGFDDDQRAAIARDGLLIGEPEPGSAPMVTTLGFWRSGQANLLLGGALSIDVPVRLLHGLEDRVVPPSVAFRIGRALRSADVQTILVKAGGHRLSRPQDLALLTRTVEALIESL